MIEKTINSIVQTFIDNEFIHSMDKIYFTNILLGKINKNYTTNELDKEQDIAILLNKFGDYAVEHLAFDKEVFINEIASLFLPTPYNFNKNFHKEKNRKKAFKNFHQFSKKSYFIKYDYLQKNIKWDIDSEFGKIDLTINLTKPEKTPQEILSAKQNRKPKYPKCSLCLENMGYNGNGKYKSRQNIRFVFDILGDEKIFMHFSPYEYFHEHLIINNCKHMDMKITNDTFIQLLEFVKKYPFYFIGSNSDIPIVGGSILSHQHYQGGGDTFSLFDAKAIKSFWKQKVEINILHWPLSTIKLVSKDINQIQDRAKTLLKKWHKYNNESLQIIAHKNGERQNAITPIARMHRGYYELYLILRNNGTSHQFPNGIFHIKNDVWNIKQENIGLIEVAGKAILPGRLATELTEIVDHLKNKDKNLPDHLHHHSQWYEHLLLKCPLKNHLEFVKKECGFQFLKGLKDCNVFANNTNDLIDFVEDIWQ